MSNNLFKQLTRLSMLIVFLLGTSFLATASSGKGWVKEFKPEKVFVENKGQFKIKETPGFDSKVQYSYNGWHQFYHFTKSGVVVEFHKKEKGEKTAEEKLLRTERKKQGFNTREEFLEFERSGQKYTFQRDELLCQWIGSNPNVEIIAEEKKAYQQSSMYKDGNGESKFVSNLATYEKLTYKNIYPNIDVVYELHSEIGYKYSVVVRPGGDISKIKLKYSKTPALQQSGELYTASIVGNIIDHKPFTFYQNNRAEIKSAYILNGNTISFSVANHDASQTIVIDPWTQTPSFNTVWDCVWECDRDAAGNAYLIGGIMPLVLQKYNSAGTLQWSVNTPYDTSNTWLGSFAVDNAGNSYVTEGTGGGVFKVNTGGTVVYNNTAMGPYISTEYWSISFNCDQTKLVIGGTGGAIPPQPYIFDVNPANGNIIGNIKVTGGALFPTQETRSITACKNGKYYFLTHDSIGYIHQGLSACTNTPGSLPFHVGTGYGMSYKCENWRSDNSGIAAIRYFNNFVYTHKGNVVHKRDFNTAAVIATGNIAGGGFASSQVQNSGIDIDTCGNVYVGSKNQVVKFDQNLNQLTTYATTFNVYDVHVSTSGDIVACGTTGTSSSGTRTGYIQLINAAACNPIAPSCCDATICTKAPLCVTAAPTTFTAYTPGGTWSGNGITNASTGAFDPAVAGVGVHTIYYTLACGRDSVSITVNSCTSTSVCRETNGDLTVSGGTGPYTWARWDSIGRTCVGGIEVFGNCTGTWQRTMGWRTYGTGATITPPVGEDSIRVVDNSGTTQNFYGAAAIAAIPPCSACPTITVSSSNIVNSNCSGNTGSFTGAASGGTGPYTFVLRNGAATVATFNNVASSQSFTALGAATYTLQVTDANSCTGTATVTITAANPPTASIAPPTNPTCGATNGSATASATGGTSPYSYLWSNGGNTATISNLAAGSYTVTVTDNQSCTATASVTLTAAGGPTLSSSPTNPSCSSGSNGSITITATGGAGILTYTWLPNVSSTSSASGLSAGTYNVTVVDRNGCSSNTTATLTDPAAIVANTSSTDANCGVADGSVSLTASGGTGTLTYLWSTNDNTATVNNLTAGNYSVTVRDANSCTVVRTASISNIGAPQGSYSSTDVSCNGGNDGSISFTINGGVPPYQYDWNPAVSSNASANGLSAGTYNVTITDDASCALLFSVDITEPLPITISIQPTDASCGASNGSAVATASGGTGTLNFVWSNQQIGANASGLSAGSYTVTVTDASSCSSVQSAVVGTTASNPVFEFELTDTLLCLGSSIILNAQQPNAQSYLWSTGATSAAITVSTAGSYSVVVSGACNSATDTAYITFESCGCDVAVPTAFSPNGDGVNDKFGAVYNCAEIKSVALRVFNRWGEKVFETSDQNEKWDGYYKGLSQPLETYVYYLNVEAVENSKPKTFSLMGNVTLIR
jgi:gliding motility-associated-like protein